MTDDALMQPITLPVAAFRLTLAAAYARGVNAGCLIGYDANHATTATVDELMANCVLQACDLARKDAAQRLRRALEDPRYGEEMIPPRHRDEWMQALAHAAHLHHEMGPIVEAEYEHFSSECDCGARIVSWPGGSIAYEPPVLPPHPR